MAKYYTASKSRSQGREGWAVIFRHPVRLDGTGKPGRRVRRGLGTTDENFATQLVAELNEILQRPELWEPAARVGLAARFDERVLDIFYDGMEPSAHDPEAMRNDILPLPDQEAGYRSVLMLGTTGPEDDAGPAAPRHRPGYGALSLDVDRQDDRGRH